MTKIAVLGSTGSIGTQTLDIVSKNEDLQVVGLAAGRNIDLLEKQIRAFRPRLAAVGDPALAKELEIRVKDTGCKVAGGMEGLIQVAVMEEAEILVTAIVGMVGIRPTIEAICAGKDIALANKETLVTAGHIIMSIYTLYRRTLYPFHYLYVTYSQDITELFYICTRTSPGCGQGRQVFASVSEDDL